MMFNKNVISKIKKNFFQPCQPFLVEIVDSSNPQINTAVCNTDSRESYFFFNPKMDDHLMEIPSSSSTTVIITEQLDEQNDCQEPSLKIKLKQSEDDKTKK